MTTGRADQSPVAQRRGSRSVAALVFESTIPASAAEDQFDAFFRRDFPNVVAYVVLLGAEGHTAEDIAAGAFQDAFRRWESIRNPPAWVRRVAGRRYVRHAAGVREDPSEPEQLEQLPGQHTRPGVQRSSRGQHRRGVDDTHGPEDFALANDMNRRLVQALEELSPTQRQVVMLAHAGRTNAEISDLLGISVDCVETHKHRGRQRLKVSLGLDIREGAG